LSQFDSVLQTDNRRVDDLGRVDDSSRSDDLGRVDDSSRVDDLGRAKDIVDLTMSDDDDGEKSIHMSPSEANDLAARELERDAEQELSEEISQVQNVITQVLLIGEKQHAE